MAWLLIALGIQRSNTGMGPKKNGSPLKSRFESPKVAQHMLERRLCRVLQDEFSHDADSIAAGCKSPSAEHDGAPTKQSPLDPWKRSRFRPTQAAKQFRLPR